MTIFKQVLVRFSIVDCQPPVVEVPELVYIMGSSYDTLSVPHVSSLCQPAWFNDFYFVWITLCVTD